jgi:transcriptional regulator with XRE-family HTH domain
MAGRSRDELGARIAAAREAAALSQEQLGHAIDRSKSVVCRIEKGERPVDSFELGLIADALGVSVRYLLGEPVEKRPRLAVAARLAARGDDEQLDKALSRVRVLLELDDLIEQIDGKSDTQVAPAPVDLDLRGNAVTQGHSLAVRVREALDLGSAPVADLFGLLEARFRVDAALEPLPEGVSGLCVGVGDRSLLVVNSDDVPGRQRFTLAHEFCHHLWGDASYEDPLIVDRDRPSKDPSEQRCDAFAAGLLMPEDGMRRALSGKEVSVEAFVGLMFEFNVSREALAWRLHDLGWISKQRVESLCGQSVTSLVRRAGRSQDLEVLFEARGRRRPPGRLEQQVIGAYERGQIGIGPVADLFGVDDREELRRCLADDGIQPSFESDLEAFLAGL